MKFFKNFIFIFLWFFGLFWSIITYAVEWSTDKDFLNQAFELSLEDDLVIWNWMVWTTKQSVWNYIMWKTVSIDAWDIIKDWVHADVNKSESFVVSLTKFLVRFTLVIAITMIIYNWIMFVIKSSKWEAPKDVLKNIGYIVAWVLLALASVIIIQLASSVGTTTISLF